MVYTILLWTGTTNLQRLALEQCGNVPFMGVFYLLFCSLGILIFLFLARRYAKDQKDRESIPNIKQVVGPPKIGSVASVGLIAGFGSVCQYSAIALINPVYVIALKETILFWSILWDWVAFRQKVTAWQFVAISTVVVGSIIVGLALKP